ncbi:four-helix bundle copper-binding protein [Marinobacter lipolyticus]|nr:four-helix bundle copper-binding protein [Marinobacter lipolyticus]
MVDKDVLNACIAACSRCAATCDYCSVACLEEDNVKEMVRCIRLDVDCANVCRLTAGALARESECLSTMARACAEVCQACGDECGKHDHTHCQDCARACKECAELCRDIAA